MPDRSSDDMTARVEALELAVAHQQRTIDDLSDALTEQWRAAETLRRQVDRLSERLAEIEPQAGQQVPIDRPPHY